MYFCSSLEHASDPDAGESTRKRLHAHANARPKEYLSLYMEVTFSPGNVLFHSRTRYSKNIVIHTG